MSQIEMSERNDQKSFQYEKIQEIIRVDSAYFGVENEKYTITIVGNVAKP